MPGDVAGQVVLAQVDHGAVGAATTTLEALGEVGASITSRVVRGVWEYVVLVPDAIVRVAAGGVEAEVADNVVVLELGDRARFVDLEDAAGSRRRVDLGPSEWDLLMGASPPE